MQSFDDLTGTFLRTVDDGSSECKTFAVFGGNKWTRVTGGQDCSGVVTGQAPNQTNWAGGYAGDHLFEQMYPLSSWGQDFVVTPIDEDVFNDADIDNEAGHQKGLLIESEEALGNLQQCDMPPST